jgi:flavodoxin
MKCIVVFYSMRGTTKKVAEHIAGALKCDLEEIGEPGSRKGPLGFLKSGREAVRKMLPPIRQPEKDPGDYDLVVLGTPVWAGTMASPMRSFLARYGKQMKKVAFFCTAGGSAGRTFQDMEAVSGHAGAAVLALVAAGAKNKNLFGGVWMNRIDDFIASLKSPGRAEPAERRAPAGPTADRIKKKLKTAASKAKKTGSKIGKGIKKAASRGKAATVKARKSVKSAARKAGSKLRAARPAAKNKFSKTVSRKKPGR